MSSVSGVDISIGFPMWLSEVASNTGCSSPSPYKIDTNHLESTDSYHAIDYLLDEVFMSQYNSK